ncbi:MAG TPA: hypothetical protein VFI90_05665 [Rubrobacter sp.]|nr:hypothetical protein [Rubrobacter sp.]
MLFVTNGDCAADRILRLGPADDVLPWRDVLHEGPVPSGLSSEMLREVRVRFIAEQGWGIFDEVIDDFVRRDSMLEGFRDHDEVVLWFEHDLYDQLQLIQVLDRFEGWDPGTTRLTMICVDDYLGNLAPDRLRSLFEDRHEVSGGALDLGHRAWLAFTSPNPEQLSDLLRRDTSALPFLEGALLRHLEQFPSVRTGLSRSETQLLDAILEGNGILREAFVSSQEREERLFLGDSVFASYFENSSATGEPLVLFEDGTRIVAPRDPADLDGFWNSAAVVTETGRTVLEGNRDWIVISGIDRWLGGVHLSGNEAPWRWDESAGQLRPGAA